MAYPIPDRVSPSGPLAAPNNAPWAEFAGKRLVYQEAEGQPTESYPGIIGADGSLTVPNPTLIMYNSAPGLYVPAGNVMPMVALGNDFGLTPGIWMVEADITCGFNTSIPTQLNGGSLNMALGVYTDAGLLVSGGGGHIAEQSPVARNIHEAGDPGAVAMSPTRSTKLVSSFELSLAQYQAAGLVPLRSMIVSFTRVSTIGADGAAVGPYDSTSGVLEFARDCSILVRRIG